MPKRTKKLLIYLDQNFISEMAKGPINERVKPEFREIYDLLHRGFVDEKLVVPQSLIHDVETSMAPHYKERIVSYQNYLGQVRLYRSEEVTNRQTDAALLRFGGDATEILQIAHVFLQDPDKRVEQLNITVDAHLQNRDFRSGRKRTGASLEALRKQQVQNGVTFNDQLQIEYDAHRDSYLKEIARALSAPVNNLDNDLISFANSKQFREVPVINISARLNAALLTNAARAMRDSDAADIEILSVYFPYMDVFCADAFMAEQLRILKLDKAYGVELFSAKTASLKALKVRLEDYLEKTAPVRRPAITVFVVPTDELKRNSFEFFRKLGASAGEMGINEYAEVYAFDDGQMPEYRLPQVPDIPVPFYGLQTVQTIAMAPGMTADQLLTACREHCRSDKFVFIDEYKDLPQHFVLGAVMSSEAGLEMASGYRICPTILARQTNSTILTPKKVATS
jgi:hypothetical protein